MAMNNENHQNPEVSENEKWYDEEVAPVLAKLAKQCTERGISFISVVEYQPGDRGGTYYLTEDAGLEMRMLKIAALTVPNVDSYIIGLIRFARENEIDTGSSIVMNNFMSNFRV